MADDTYAQVLALREREYVAAARAEARNRLGQFVTGVTDALNRQQALGL